MGRQFEHHRGMNRPHTSVQETRVLLIGLHLTCIRAKANANPPGVRRCHLKTCVVEGHLRRRDGELRNPRHTLHLLMIDIGCRLEIGDLTGNLTWELTGIEVRDPADPRASLDQALPKSLLADAVRGNGAETGNHHTLLLCHGTLLLPQCWRPLDATAVLLPSHVEQY